MIRLTDARERSGQYTRDLAGLCRGRRRNGLGWLYRRCFALLSAGVAQPVELDMRRSPPPPVTALLGSIAFLAGAIASDTRNSVYALLLLAAS